MSQINVKDFLDIAEAVKPALEKLAASPKTDMVHSDVPVVATTVEKVVDKQTTALQKEVNAVVDHATNNEPWYLSRVTIGAIVSIAMPILGLVGITADIISPDELTGYILAGGVIVGGATTLWGRWVARKPIGQ